MIKTIVEIFQLDAKTGKIKDYQKTHNVVLTSGKNEFWKEGSCFSKIGIGTDDTTPDASQTGLLAEVIKEDATDLRSRSDNVVTIEHTFKDWTSSYTIKEAGIVLSSGGYFNRVTFDSVTVDENNNIKIKFTVTVTD